MTMTLPTTVLAILEGQAKRCTKCGEWKGLGEFSRGDGWFGRRARCKACEYDATRETKALYYQKTKPERLEQQRLRRLRQPEAVRAYNAAYYLDKQELIRATQQKWRDINRDRKRSADRLRMHLNRDQINERRSLFRSKERDRLRHESNFRAARERAVLSDRYVRECAANTLHLPTSEIAPEIVAIKRELLTTKRLVRKLTTTVMEKDHE